MQSLARECMGERLRGWVGLRWGSSGGLFLGDRGSVEKVGLVVKGDGFTGVTAVAFGVNDPATDVVVLTGGKITCTVPAWIPEIPQLASVTVTGPAGTSNAAYDGITYYYSLDN